MAGAVDYGALAQQARDGSAPPAGRVDYAALADEARGNAPKSPVAPGSSDDDLIKQFGFDPAVIKSSSRYQDAVKAHGSGVSFYLTDPSKHPSIDKLQNAPVLAQMSDIGSGGEELFKGIIQLARHGASKFGLISDADAQYGDLIDRLSSKDYAENIRHGNASPALRTIGNIVTGAALPVAEAPVGAGIVRQGATAALNGATAAATQPVESGPPGDFWQDKGKQVATGAVVAPVVAGAAGVVGKGVAKVINARSTGGVPQDAADLMAAGKQHGVRLTYGDISRNPSVQKAEVTMESLPMVGMSKERAAQQVEAKTAAQNLADSRYQKFLDTDPGLITDIEGAAKGGDARAKNLLDQLQNAGNDPDKVLQTSIGLGDFRTRQEAEHLYDKVEDLVKKNNLPEVPLTGTTAAVDRALGEAESSKLPDRQLIGILRDIKAGISPKAVKQSAASAIVDQFGRTVPPAPAAPGPAGNDYGAIRQLRSDLGNKIQMYMNGENGIIGEKGVGQLQSVKNALESDLTNFTQNSGVPEVQKAAKTADQYYKVARVPYKDAMLAAASADKEPDQIFQRFIQAGKGDRAQRFYDALDPKGQEAVRYKMVSTAVDKATNDATGAFSPQKYFTAMNKLDDATGVFFKGADKAEIDGFNNLMAHVTRAGQYAENPPTGQRLAAGLVTAGTIINPVMAARVATVAAASKLLFTTDAGKAFLLASSKLAPGSLKMASLMNQITKAIPAAAARAATTDQQ